MVHKIIGFNHISDGLSYDEVNKLKTLYKSYHKLQMCYKWKYKKITMIKVILDSSRDSFNRCNFLSDLKVLDDIIINQSPSIDKYSDKYDKVFN